MKKTLDAKGQTLGRLASQAAVLLMGKNLVSYTRNTHPEIIVEIVNAGKLRVSARKLAGKRYVRYTGYPGGLKSLTLEQVVEKKGMQAVLRDAIYGMLPSNKLRPRMLKNLIIHA